MKRSIRTPIKDERDQQIETVPGATPLIFVVAITQVLTIMCIIKGNSAWKGSLSLLFFGAGAILLYKYEKYEEKPYLAVGIVLGIIGSALLAWFGLTG